MDEKERFQKLVEGLEIYHSPKSPFSSVDPQLLIEAALKKEGQKASFLEELIGSLPNLILDAHGHPYLMGRDHFKKTIYALRNINEGGFFYIHANSSGFFDISSRPGHEQAETSVLVSYNDFYVKRSVRFKRMESNIN